jgi:hypothetical protein
MDAGDKLVHRHLKTVPNDAFWRINDSATEEAEQNWKTLTTNLRSVNMYPYNIVDLGTLHCPSSCGAVSGRYCNQYRSDPYAVSAFWGHRTVDGFNIIRMCILPLNVGVIYATARTVKQNYAPKVVLCAVRDNLCRSPQPR